MKSEDTISNIIIGFLIIGMITFPYVLKNDNSNVDKIMTLFTDNFNLLSLIIIVCICLYLNLKVGIVLALFVLYIAFITTRIYNSHEGFDMENIIVEEEESDYSMRNNNPDINDVIAEEDDMITEPFSNQVKENFIRGTVPIVPTPEMKDGTKRLIDFLPSKNTGNRNIHPHTYGMSEQSEHPAMSPLIDNIMVGEENETLEGFANKYNSNPNNQAVKLSTQDVMGCRYDSFASPMNAMYNGPPLATCHGYDLNTFDKSGTLFYPLNA